jgi:hypothetical protein
VGDDFFGEGSGGKGRELESMGDMDEGGRQSSRKSRKT